MEALEGRSSRHTHQPGSHEIGSFREHVTPTSEINGLTVQLLASVRLKRERCKVSGSPWVHGLKTVPFLTVLLFSLSGSDSSRMHSLGAQYFRRTRLTDDYIKSTNILLGIQNNSRPHVSIFESVSVCKGKTFLLQKMIGLELF